MTIQYQTGAMPLPERVKQSGEHLMVSAMEHRGYTVILEDTGREFVVKVRVKGSRQIRHASTSGYPIRQAYADLLKVRVKAGAK